VAASLPRKPESAGAEGAVRHQRRSVDPDIREAAEESNHGGNHKHLKGEGRSSSANNALGKLVREKKLKRTPIVGKRGSRYSLA
jgi:hypothetical protein